MLSLKRTELPEVLVAQFPEADNFEVSTDGSTIFLRPVRVLLNTAAEVREHFDRLGITEQDLLDALAEVRAERDAARSL